MLDRQPVLEGERLTLRPLVPADWDALFAVASDPLIWEQHPAHDRWQEPVFRAFFDDALANAGALIAMERLMEDPMLDDFDAEHRGRAAQVAGEPGDDAAARAFFTRGFRRAAGAGVSARAPAR